MPCLGVWEGARARSNAQGIGCNSLSLSPNQDSAEPVEATTECQDQSPGAELEIQFGLREIEIVDGPLPDIERLEQLVALGEHQWHWGPISERWRREAQKLLPISSTELTKAKEKLEAQRGSRPGNFGFLVCIIRSQRENPKPSRKSQPALPSNIQSMLDGAFRYAQQMGEASYV